MITNFGDNDTLRITAGSVVSNKYNDDDYVVSVKGANYSGSITLKDVGDTPIRVRNTKGTVSVINYAKSNMKDNTTVSGTKNADRIFNSGSYAMINAGNGNDLIYNAGGGDNTTINAGAGNDTVSLADLDNGVKLFARDALGVNIVPNIHKNPLSCAALSIIP